MAFRRARGVAADREIGDGRAAALLEVDNLTVRFPTEDGVVQAVRGLSYRVQRHEVLGVVGESGSGKSAAALAVLGLLPRTARVGGRVLLLGRDLLAMTEAQRRSMRGRRIAMIFQDPMTALNPVHTVGDQVAEAVRAHEPVSRATALARAADMLDLVGIPRPRESLRAYPHELSGGMRQRVVIAMSVINRPDVIIADEPTTALDVTVQAQILQTLLEVKDAVGAAVVLITHDLGVVAGIAHRVLVMYAGRVVEVGAVDEVFAAPRMPYTAGLLGSIPALDRADGRLRPVPGAPPSLVTLPSGCPFHPRCPLADATSCRTLEPVLAGTGERAGAGSQGAGAGHLAACHHRDRMARLTDPRTIFQPTSEAGGDPRPAVDPGPPRPAAP